MWYKIQRRSGAVVNSFASAFTFLIVQCYKLLHISCIENVVVGCFKDMLSVTLNRVSEEPVVAPDAVPGYGAIFNAGVIHHDGILHLFARGVRDGYRRNGDDGPRFADYISDILVFTSSNGIEYEFQQVLARGSSDTVFSYEDPRVQRVHSDGREHIVMTYTHFPDPSHGKLWQIGLDRLVFEGDRFVLHADAGHIVGPPGYENKDAVVFNLDDGRVALIHRLHPDMQLAVFDSLDDLLRGGEDYWRSHLDELDYHTILRPSPGALGIGAGAPPVYTEHGLLLFFHERNAEGVYTMNLALLDHETGRISRKLTDPVLIPELPWERWGDVDDVVFVGGAHRFSDGTIYLTYGAADRAVGAATVHETDLLRALLVSIGEDQLNPISLLERGDTGNS